MNEPSKAELIARVNDPYVCTDALHHQLAAALRDTEANNTRLTQQIAAVRKYAEECERYGRRNRTAVASDLLAILDPFPGTPPMTAEEREAAYWRGPGCEEDDRG